MKFEYPSQLPVSTARDDIAEAVRASQVVIISGQTGSGKTTQLPKILLELGRGSHGRQIVHTQPRRLAARTVAERIASEMGVKLGEEVGYQVRFTDESSPKTRLRVVTDGILLAQIQRDPKLMQYDTIVIDEAHERSLNKPYETLQAVCKKEQILAAREQVKKVHVHELLLKYMADLVQATRKDKEILSGVSPRGTMALLRASQAYAWIRGRDYVVPEDIKTVADPVMAHRLVLSRGFGGAVTGQTKIEEILGQVSVPTEEWER